MGGSGSLRSLRLLQILTNSTQDKDGEKKLSKSEQAQRDIQMGMAGMQQAAQDPAMLAQLMKDMQDPEMIAEAKKMMESKEFKKQMKKLEKDPNFKKAMDQAGQAFEDPRTAGMMTAKAEQMMREGGAQVSVVFWHRCRLPTTPQFAYQLVSDSLLDFNRCSSTRCSRTCRAPCRRCNRTRGS